MRKIEEIEQLAEQYLQKNKYNFDNWKEIEHSKITYINAYTQCQEDMQKDVEYWQGEFEHWHQQAMAMAEKKYTKEDIINIVTKSRGSGLTAEYLILQLNKQD
jgi:hypothetical protein